MTAVVTEYFMYLSMRFIFVFINASVTEYLDPLCHLVLHCCFLFVVYAFLLSPCQNKFYLAYGRQTCRRKIVC